MVCEQLFGAIEIGGTKIICAVGHEDGSIVEKFRFPTSTPKENLPQMIDFLRGFDIGSVGVGTVGPVNLHGSIPEYGTILACPREAWSYCRLAESLAAGLNVPIAVDSDVNAACIGESRFGAGKGKQNVLYITVGTGIGIGIVIDGKPLHGMLHPEGGHSKVERYPGDAMQSSCRFHPDCAEGMASGTALGKRIGGKGELLSEDDPVWDIEAHYLSQLVRNCMQIVSPNVIVMGGGVMDREFLFPMIRRNVASQLHGHYIWGESQDMDSYIVPSQLGGNQALMGCLAMAADTFGHPTCPL
jgi:fructokinase